MELHDAVNYSTGKIRIPHFIEEEGIFDVVLIEKMWGKAVNLICVFKKGNGELFSTTAWRRSSDDPFPEHYAPKKSDIEFRDVEKGTKWRCIFKKSPNGKRVDWLTAEPL